MSPIHYCGNLAFRSWQFAACPAGHLRATARDRASVQVERYRPGLRVSVSNDLVGTEEGHCLQGLLKLADKTLYAAKQGGYLRPAFQ